MMILTYITIGLCIGSLSGTLGIGGGVLLVPALVWLCGFDVRKASGTSLAILVPPIGLPAAWYAFRKGQVELEATLWIAAAFMVGAFGSRLLVEYLPEHLLRLLFGLLMLYISLRFVISADAEAAKTLAGLIAVGLALGSLLVLRWLGRRHSPPPDLGEEIQRREREGHGDHEYHI